MTWLETLGRDGGAWRVAERSDAGFTIVPAEDDEAGFLAFQAVAQDALDRADDSYRALPHRAGDHEVAGWDAVTIEFLH